MKIVLACVILSMVATAFAFTEPTEELLDCFTCNSYTDMVCGDQFHHESDAIRKMYLTTCRPTKNEQGMPLLPFCRKTKTYIDRTGEYRIHRDCGYLSLAGKDCYQRRSEELITDVCQCTTALCNAGFTTTPYVAALLAPLAAVMLL